MIVHDGSHFPYIDIIVQNAHYYIDTLIDTINSYAEKGYQSLETMYVAMQQAEFSYICTLEETENDGTPKIIEGDFSKFVIRQ